MADNIYDEIEIEVRSLTPYLCPTFWLTESAQDMTFDSALQIYHYPCPCGDRFQIAIDDLRDGEEIAVCPSCSLQIRVIFEKDDLPKPEDDQRKMKSHPQSAQQQPVAVA